MHIEVRQLAEQVSADEDAAVSGRYAVRFEHDVSALGCEQQASAALDLFHACVAVAVLEDFEFTVLDEHGNAVQEDPGHEPGSSAVAGVVIGPDGTEYQRAEIATAAFLDRFRETPPGM